MKLQQQQQKEWIQEQIADKEAIKTQTQFNKEAFDQQALAFNEILKQTQEQHEAQRKGMKQSVA